MNVRKKLHWFGIFMILGIATGWLGTGIVAAAPGGGKSLVQVVKAANMEKSAKVVVLPEEAGKGFLQKFSRKMDDKTICSVSQSQYARLAADYGATLDKITVGGNEVDVVKVAAKKKDILDVLQGDHTGPGKCKTIKKQNFFIMMFNANVS